MTSSIRSAILLAANGIGGSAIVSEGHSAFPSTEIISQVESSRWIFRPQTGNLRRDERNVAFRNFNPGPHVDLLYAAEDIDIEIQTPVEADPNSPSGNYEVWMFSHPGAADTRVFIEDLNPTAAINNIFSENTTTIEGQEFVDSDWRIYTIEAPTGLRGIDFNTGVRLSRQNSNGGFSYVNLTMDVRVAYGGTNPRVVTNDPTDTSPAAGLAIDGASWARPDLVDPFADSFDDWLITSQGAGTVTFRHNNPGITFPRNWGIEIGNFQRGHSRYHIAIRRRDSLSANSETQNRFSVTSINGHRLGDQTDYSYQNRLAMVLEASSSLQGTPGRITVEVQGLCPIVRTRTGQSFDTWSDLFISNQEQENEAIYVSPSPAYFYPTSNPAAWFRHFLLGRKNEAGELLYGLGLSPDQIDHRSLREWYDYCEEENLQVNCIYEAGRTKYDVLLHLASVGEAQLTEGTGKIGVFIDRALPGLTPIATYTEADVVANSFRDVNDTRRVTDGIEYEFHNAANDYILQTETVPNPLTLSTGGARIRPGGLTEVPRTLNLFGVTNAIQARRAAVRESHLEEARNRQVRIALAEENFHLTVGDIISLNHRDLGRMPDGEPRSEIFIVESIRYRNGMMELGLLRNSLPHPDDVPADYRGPTIPRELLPMDQGGTAPPAGGRGDPQGATGVDLTVMPDVVEGTL